MATNIRSSISKKNPYYISKHRYYELKHYCLQYYEWKKLKRELEISSSSPSSYISVETREWSDPTGNTAVLIHELDERMAQIERLVVTIDPSISEFLFKSITEGVSYTYLRTVMDIPCSKEYFYRRYRKFWWLLSNLKDGGYDH